MNRFELFSALESYWNSCIQMDKRDQIRQFVSNGATINMPDRLYAMRVFVSVVDAGSFSLAAEQLALSRGMTSRHVAQLEASLGVRLLNRTTRRLSLTSAGQDYYQRAIQIIGLVEEADRAAASEVAQPRGLLRVNAPVSFSALHLGQALSAYLANHSEVRVALSLVDREVDLVEEGFDLALRITRKVDDSLIARPLAPVRVLACASPGYLAEHGEPLHPHQLSEHHCLQYAHTQDDGIWSLSRSDEVCDVRIHGRLLANNGDVLCNAAVAGLGIVLQPTFMIRHLLDSGQLVRVLPGWETVPLMLSAVYADRRLLPLKIRSFIDFLVDYFDGEPLWDQDLDAP